MKTILHNAINSVIESFYGLPFINHIDTSITSSPSHSPSHQQSQFFLSSSSSILSFKHITYISEYIYQTTIEMSKIIYENFFIIPLARLYLWAPTLNGWGGLGGQNLQEICAQMTHLSSDFWDLHRPECMDMVSKKFYGLVVVFETFFYFIILFYIIHKFCLRIKK